MEAERKALIRNRIATSPYVAMITAQDGLISVPQFDKLEGKNAATVCHDKAIYASGTGKNSEGAYVAKLTPGAAACQIVAGNMPTGIGTHLFAEFLGLCVDASRNVYFVDAENNRVVCWEPRRTIRFP